MERRTLHLELGMSKETRCSDYSSYRISGIYVGFSGSTGHYTEKYEQNKLGKYMICCSLKSFTFFSSSLQKIEDSNVQN
jgi:hypothetical protein